MTITMRHNRSVNRTLRERLQSENLKDGNGSLAVTERKNTDFPGQ